MEHRRPGDEPVAGIQRQLGRKTMDRAICARWLISAPWAGPWSPRYRGSSDRPRGRQPWFRCAGPARPRQWPFPGLARRLDRVSTRRRGKLLKVPVRQPREPARPDRCSAAVHRGQAASSDRRRSRRFPLLQVRPPGILSGYATGSRSCLRAPRLVPERQPPDDRPAPAVLHRSVSCCRPRWRGRGRSHVRGFERSNTDQRAPRG